MNKTRLTLEELLKISSNSLTDRTLVIRDTEEANRITIPGDTIDVIEVHIPSIYLILDGTNNRVKTIILHQEDTRAGFKNLNPKCQIVINKKAVIELLALKTGEIILDNLYIDTEEE